jgi:hypothetical protein
MVNSSQIYGSFKPTDRQQAVFVFYHSAARWGPGTGASGAAVVCHGRHFAAFSAPPDLRGAKNSVIALIQTLTFVIFG